MNRQFFFINWIALFINKIKEHELEMRTAILLFHSMIKETLQRYLWIANKFHIFIACFFMNFSKCCFNKIFPLFNTASNQSMHYMRFPVGCKVCIIFWVADDCRYCSASNKWLVWFNGIFTAAILPEFFINNDFGRQIVFLCKSMIALVMCGHGHNRSCSV